MIPVTKADKSVDTLDNTYQPMNDLDRKNWEACECRSLCGSSVFRPTSGANQNRCSADDPEIYDGGPVGLQIMGRKFEEEKVLAIAKVIYAALLKEKKGLTSAL